MRERKKLSGEKAFLTPRPGHAQADTPALARGLKKLRGRGGERKERTSLNQL